MNAITPQIEAAHVCGPKVAYDPDWREKPKLKLELTKAEKVMLFAETFLRVPEGEHVGQPLRIEPFQECFLRSVFDNEHLTRDAVLSVARRNGKTFLIAIIILAYLVGPLALYNSTIASAANSRDQAALIFRMMHLMVEMSEQLSRMCRVVPSSKKIISLVTGTEFYAMAADAKTGYGRSLQVVVLDESGQIKGETTEYVQMLRTSQGSFDQPLFVTISTQAPSDNDFLSRMIDDAIRSQDPHTVVHLYTTPKEYEITDQDGWYYSNPGLGVFRSILDMKSQIERAVRLPSEQAAMENLLLNRRVARDGLWLAPQPWRECSEPPDMDAFRTGFVAVGLDLSARNDLTAAVAAVRADDGGVSLLPFCFTPEVGLETRAAKDRAPYDAWVRDGFMYTAGRKTMDYEIVFREVSQQLQRFEISPDLIVFDRWRIEDAKRAASNIGVFNEVPWVECGQGFKDMAPRCEAFEALMLDGRLRHGGHPLLNMAAANTIVDVDAAGAKKPTKAKSTQRIDPIVAALMAAYEVTDGMVDRAVDVEALIA